MAYVDEASQITRQLLDSGFDQGACRVNRDELHELQAENAEINLFRTNFETEVSLSGIKDQRRASLLVNRSDESSLKEATKTLGEMADGANADPAFAYAEAQPSDEFRAGPEEPDYDLMYDRIAEVQTYAAATYPKLNLRSVGVTFSSRDGCYVNSNDVQFETSRGVYRVSVSFSSKEGEKTSSMMYTGYSRYGLDTRGHRCLSCTAPRRGQTPPG